MEYLIKEANHCLKCKNPRCKNSCPVRTAIPEVITLFEQGKLEEAGKLLFDNNPLSAITAIVCPHEDQCVGNCIRGIKGEPVKFCKIEQYISEQYLKNAVIEKKPNNQHKVAIVGSGPAGLTVAIRLAQKGYNITIFELKDKIGGMLTYGIPEFRLPRTYVDDIERILHTLGVSIKPNNIVGPVITLDKLLNDGYDAIFIGTGVWNPRTLNVKGETLPHTLYAIDYLENPKVHKIGERVCVIGAGNVAMDAARTAKYYGSKDVQIFYRRGFENMTATKAEINEAKEDGIVFNLYKKPIEITDEGVIFESTQLMTHEDGSVTIETVPDSRELFPCDNVIISISQTPQSNIVGTSPDLKTEHGLIFTDHTGHTSKKGVFACGDVVSGAKTVIDAVEAAKIVENSIDEYCQGL